MLMRVCSLPFIIRNTEAENTSEALSLIAATWSLATIISGLIIGGLNWVSSIKLNQSEYFFDERLILWIISIIGIFGVFFAIQIKEKIERKDKEDIKTFNIQKLNDI